MRAGFTVLAVACGLAAGAVPHGAVAPNAETRTITHDGRARTYEVHDFAGRDPAPVVIVLHGGGGNAASAIRMTGFDRVASRERFIAVYPEGTSGRAGGRLLTWNASHCCAAAMDARVDDVGFVGAIVDALVASGRADAARVYVTGMSNGAMLTHRIGRELSTRIAAIGPVVGALFGDEPAPRAAVPAFVVTGADDSTVPGAGGPLAVRLLLGRRSAANRDVAPAIAQATYWAGHNGCGDPTRSESAAWRRTEWTACRSGAPVVFYSVTGNGHAWPGGQPGRSGADAPSAAFDATAEMWAFFKTQVRRR